MTVNNSEVIQIDIKKIIRNQNNKTIKKLPDFAIGFIKWLIMEKEMNKTLKFIHPAENYEFSKKILEYLNAKVEVIGKENLPENPNFIFAGNHALGGMDFFAIIEAVKDKYPSINHLTNEILLSLSPIADLMVPVNVFGKNTEKYNKIYDQKLKDITKPITIFPSGEVARYDNGKWDDSLWRSGFIRFAKKFNRPVVPFFIPTKNSPCFYRISNWRKFFRIKANIEMFLLPRQIYYQRNKTIKIIIGKPIPPETFDNTRTIHQWAEYVKNIAYGLNLK